MEEEEESCHKCKCIFIDETGSQSSCSVTDDYIAREIQKMELVFKSEEAGQESELLKGVSCDVYSLDSNISSGEDQIRNCSETDFSDNDDDLSVINLDTILKKDTSAFLFRNENLEPLTFVLLLNDSSAELKLKKIIEKSGGLVYPKVKDMDDYSIVLIKDSKLLTAHVGPVFKLDYLLKCVSKNKIVSINPYQRTFNNAPPLHNFDFMNVVYFKQLGWSEVPYHVLLNKLVKDVGEVKKESEITPPRAVQCTVRDSDEEVGKMNKTQQRSTVQDNSDDEFRITNKAQKQSTVAARKNNKSEEQSTAEARKTNKMQQRSTVQDSSDDEFRITYKIQKRSPQKQFKHIQSTFFNSSSDDIDDDNDRKTKPPKLSPIKSEKLKRKNINRHTRMLYSDEEDSSIVRYIADNDGYNSVKGTLLWRNMERVNICPKRTWQSMKEHFLKKIMYNINSFAFLTDSQKRKFQKLLLK